MRSRVWGVIEWGAAMKVLMGCLCSLGCCQSPWDSVRNPRFAKHGMYNSRQRGCQ